MKFKAQLHIKSEAEGGRHVPFFTDYAPNVSVDGNLYPCKIILPSETQMVMPGSDIILEIETEDIVLGPGTKIELIEQGHVTASGSIASL